ncbi:sucrase ferredoxin [Labedaea rhizosphaerae]|uniref:Sucrase/ferredoxin-like protein n=1 Tax=Labedaea rhizosphaerae TaxID=598644 RepID=A0A4R6RVX5_LABRH|nr:sucrase ferredoxin [Labedaea rhizosphaerae]TDP91130.1 hypothetical protein EV186_109122 [Labedaea rhizosphaerae]
MADRCSVLSAAAAEPTAGTAAVAVSWLCIEQSGPWGRDALSDSHFDAEVGAALAERVKGTGVRIAMIRRPGRHADRHVPAPHTILLAHTAPGQSWLEHTVCDEPKQLLDLDLAALGRGQRPGFGEVTSDPVLLVCTNGRRDLCCALEGRPIAAELAADHGTQVWESSHLGGHRFAPTAVQLPTGYSYGRIDVAFGADLLRSTAVRVERCRGRSTWDAEGQVAELAVRARLGDSDPDSLTVTGTRVTHRDGRAWDVTIGERIGPARPASCGAAPKPQVSLIAESVMPTAK